MITQHSGTYTTQGKYQKCNHVLNHASVNFVLNLR